MKPQKITKKRVDRHDLFQNAIDQWISDQLHECGVDSTFYLKTSAYHSRYFFALRQGSVDKVHLVLSRKRDYVTTVRYGADVESKLTRAGIERYIKKHFTISRAKTTFQVGQLVSTSQYISKSGAAD